MSKAALLELADRVERASGEDRELANDVLLECGWICEEYRNGPDSYLTWAPSADHDDMKDGDQPDPTSSLDAAMTLVPNNVYWMAAYGKRTPEEPLGACALYHPGVDAPFVEVEAHSVALALTAACLRARAQQESKDA